ncbi:cytochrome P450 [Tilletiaria anomala UBC 951]|uniref:Cytochrome P450 n=1 Tax=Tilletiaria anomala (strain ATCC 24038 / CBS 436.72 / UBC 951) TaxID=1037660 RepID=A0A066W3P0_TILAU|nr:cytochrome P450 [Tilletiaria anomala UBC 951]KDN47173.1 cytochrome P450 [Tilletiaria anomala UBC 951]
MSFVLAAVAVAATIYWVVRTISSPPASFDRSVPVVPIWVSWLPFLRHKVGLPPLGQDVIFARYIEPRLRCTGMVVLFFGGRWNLLCCHPAAIRQLFRGNGGDDDLFAKSGNHRKIPGAVISQLTGSNIISEHGEPYKRYRKLLGPPLRMEVDYISLNDSSQRLVKVLALRASDKPIGINAILQRFTMDIVCRNIFGVDLEFLKDPPPLLHSIHSRVKFHIFQPFALAFPKFDHPRWSYIFPGRTEARTAVEAMEAEVEKVLIAQGSDSRMGKIPCDMQAEFEEGCWTAQEVMDNTKILFIAGHENTQNALNSLLMVLATHPNLQRRLRAEVRSVFEGGAFDAPIVGKDHLERLPQLMAFIYETMRLYPPIPMLLNRRASSDTIIHLFNPEQNSSHAITVAAGTYVGWHAYGLHRSSRSSLWAPDPTSFRPERWGSTTREIEALARRAETSGEYIPFAAGVRLCAGRKLAMAEIVTALVHILHSFQLNMPPGPAPSLTPGGLLSVHNLYLILTCI